MERSSLTRRRRALGAVLAALSATALLVPLQTNTALGQESPVSLTVDPAAGLGDADLVTVTVRTAADYPVHETITRLCRAGVDYQPGTAGAPNRDFEFGGANCPNIPVSTSAQMDVRTDSRILGQATTPAGAEYTFQVGTGVVTWEGPDPGSEFTLTCDDEHPCALVTQVYAGPNPKWTPFVQELDFGAVDPITGCGGPADGILSTAGSDRMTDAWIGWTLDECAGEGSSGAKTRAVFSGEAEAVTSFVNGLSDIAYTGVGLDPGAALAPEGRERGAVPVPVGLNAVVLAVAGGRVLESGAKVRYENIHLTNEEVARLVAGGDLGLGSEGRKAVEARNPEVNPMFIDSINLRVAAASERGTVTYLTTRFLRTLEAEAFTVPPFSVFEPNGDRPRGIDSSFALADPPYAGAMDLFSGRPPLKRALSLLSPQLSGGVWVVTDLATARALKLTVVSIETAHGEAVAPTPEAMLTAVDTMEADDEGFLVPDPEMSAGDGPVPYPLTYVEYAVAPAEPLITTSSCTLRTGSQSHLDAWLGYITGPGQERLPAGMVPLPTDLKEEAEARIDEVGSSEVTGTCAGRTSTTTSTTSTTVAGSPTTVSSSGSGEEAASSSQSPRAPGRSTPRETASAPADPGATVEITEEPDEVELAMPAFSGVVSDDPWRALASLVGIVGLTALVTVATAGSVVPGWRRRPGDGPPAAGGS